MKKKLLCVILTGLCMASLIACGKSERDQAAEYYQDELGFSEEEAEELADAFYGDESVQTGNSQDAGSEAESTNSIKLVEPASEIVNSNISDPIVQIYDAVIPFDGSMTVGQVLDAINNATEFEVSLDSKDENSLANVMGIGDSSLWTTVIDENGKSICTLVYVNTSDSPMKVYDCPVVEIDLLMTDSVHSLNCFYAGNICDGIYTTVSSFKETAEYERRLADYPVLTYDEIPVYLENQGIHYVKFSGNEFLCHVFPGVVGYEMNGDEMCPRVDISFTVDMATGLCSNIRFGTVWGARDRSAYYLESLEGLSDEQVRIIDDTVQGVLSEVVSEPMTLYGYSYRSGVNNFYLIYKTESNQFFAKDVKAYIQYDGNVGCSENISTWITMKPSIEEVIAFETLDEITEFSYGN
ncbi:MAG: hypothetical protein ACI4DW_08645 [Lachnospiraceae bacterium]